MRNEIPEKDKHEVCEHRKRPGFHVQMVSVDRDSLSPHDGLSKEMSRTCLYWDEVMCQRVQKLQHTPYRPTPDSNTSRSGRSGPHCLTDPGGPLCMLYSPPA